MENTSVLPQKFLRKGNKMWIKLLATKPDLKKAAGYSYTYIHAYMHAYMHTYIYT